MSTDEAMPVAAPGPRQADGTLVLAANDDDAPDPESVAAAFGLPVPVTAWATVDGAWSNKVFRLETGGRAFAVKEMRNPWRVYNWQDWLTESWSFELLAIEAGSLLLGRLLIRRLAVAWPG